MAAIISILSLSLLFLSVSNAHNITQILESDSDLSTFNDYLTRTRLADEINSRQTITVLALSNAAMSSLTSGHPLSVVKNLLSLHVLLDYYDPTKLHSLHNGTVLSTTLYQTTGVAGGQVGFVNITDVKGGGVAFGSGQSGSKLSSTYTKSIKQIPYNVSVIEISAPIIAPALLTAPAPSASDVNLTALLEKAGCKTFASLISKNGVLKFYQTQMENGLTVFAPNDEAFKAKGVPDLSKLSNAELVSLLQYHALTSYAPVGTLKQAKGSLATLAGTTAGKFGITVSTAGDSVTLHTGVDSSRVATTILDSTPVAIYSVDSILLPAAIFATSPTPAPAPAPKSTAPAPAHKAESPAPVEAPGASPIHSPPAPPTDSPAGAPEADAPSKAADEKSKNAAAEGRSPALLMMVCVSVASGVISLVL